jgi:hypothetical protein
MCTWVSDPGTYMVRIRFTFKNRVWQPACAAGVVSAWVSAWPGGACGSRWDHGSSRGDCLISGPFGEPAIARRWANVALCPPCVVAASSAASWHDKNSPDQFTHALISCSTQLIWESRTRAPWWGGSPACTAVCGWCRRVAGLGEEDGTCVMRSILEG